MKLVQHPNVVRLYEVIDTQTKLYLILELGDGGDLYDYIMRHDSGLSEEVRRSFFNRSKNNLTDVFFCFLIPQVARTYFRQIVRAISYCHRLHVVHRDLKPENVVFFEKLGMVKLTDFGFSNRFCPGQKLETSCGSLAYSAPEILLGDSYDAPAVGEYFSSASFELLISTLTFFYRRLVPRSHSLHASVRSGSFSRSKRQRDSDDDNGLQVFDPDSRLRRV